MSSVVLSAGALSRKLLLLLGGSKALWGRSPVCATLYRRRTDRQTDSFPIQLASVGLRPNYLGGGGEVMGYCEHLECVV